MSSSNRKARPVEDIDTGDFDKEILELPLGTQRNVYSKVFLEEELKSFIQRQAFKRGNKESQLLRWLILRGLNTVPGVTVIETGTGEK